MSLNCTGDTFIWIDDEPHVLFLNRCHAIWFIMDAFIIFIGYNVYWSCVHCSDQSPPSRTYRRVEEQEGDHDNGDDASADDDDDEGDEDEGEYDGEEPYWEEWDDEESEDDDDDDDEDDPDWEEGDEESDETDEEESASEEDDEAEVRRRNYTISMNVNVSNGPRLRVGEVQVARRH